MSPVWQLRGKWKTKASWMEKTRSAPTGEHIIPLARAQRLVSETRTTCLRGRGHATIRHTAGRRKNGKRNVTFEPVPQRRLLPALLPQPLVPLMPVSVAGVLLWVALDPDPGRSTTLRFTLRLLRNYRALIAQIKN
jgi:hypothetical protein